MIETIVKCDVCSKPAKSYRMVIGKEMDASGNGYNDKNQYNDYCFEHLIEHVRMFPEHSTYENFQK